MVQTLWDTITEFLAGGDKRTEALQEGIRENVTPFVPPNLREPLGLLAEVNPVQDIYRAGGNMRGGNYVDAGIDTAIAAAPVVGGVLGRVGANQLADTGGDAARAAMDTLLGGAPGRSASAVDAFAERASQRGPVPTMYSNPLLGDIEDYAGVHRAPGRNPDNASLDDLTNLFPDDIYDRRVAAQYYGHMEDPVADQEMIDLFARMRGNPDAKIPVYRAVPSNVDAGVNPGDWVTPSRRYAVGHGEGPLGGDYKIVETEARAGDLFTDANSIFEFGYDPAQPLPTPRNDAEAMARDILDMRAAGRAGDVTDDMMSAADPQYMFANTPLPMDEASRMARAGGMGFDTDTPLFHGTLRPHVAPDDFSNTRNYNETGGTYVSDSYHGPGYYTTTSSRDASSNYANIEGPDVNNKIGSASDRLTDMDFDEFADEVRLGLTPEELETVDPKAARLLREVNAKDQNALTTGDVEEFEDYLSTSGTMNDIADLMARRSVGPTEGLVNPVYGRARNPVRTKGRDSTFFELQMDLGNPDDFLDEAGGDMDLAEDLAVEWGFDQEPVGLLVDAANASTTRLRDAGLDSEADELMGRILEAGYEGGGTTAADLEHIVRNSPAMERAIDYDVSAGPVLQDAYRAMGYDAIDLPTPATTFSGMPNLEGTAFHRVFTDPTAIRSRFARFDPEFSHLRNLSAGIAGGGLLAIQDTEQQREEEIRQYLGGLL